MNESRSPLRTPGASVSTTRHSTQNRSSPSLFKKHFTRSTSITKSAPAGKYSPRPAGFFAPLRENPIRLSFRVLYPIRQAQLVLEPGCFADPPSLGAHAPEHVGVIGNRADDVAQDRVRSL